MSLKLAHYPISIPFKSHFCGQWMQHPGYTPSVLQGPRMVLKRGHFRFAERLHRVSVLGGVELNGREVRLPPDPALGIDHFSYNSVEHYLLLCQPCFEGLQTDARRIVPLLTRSGYYGLPLNPSLKRQRHASHSFTLSASRKFMR